MVAHTSLFRRGGEGMGQEEIVKTSVPTWRRENNCKISRNRLRSSLVGSFRVVAPGEMADGKEEERKEETPPSPPSTIRLHRFMRAPLPP